MLTAKETVNRMRFNLSIYEGWKIDCGMVKYDPATQYPKASYDAEAFIGRIESIPEPVRLTQVLSEVALIQTRLNELRETERQLGRLRATLERSVTYRLLRYQVMTESVARLISRTTVAPWNNLILENDNLEVLEASANKMFLNKDELVYIQAPDGRGFAVLSRLLLGKVESGKWKTDFLDHIPNPDEFRGTYPRPKLLCRGQLIEEKNL